MPSHTSPPPPESIGPARAARAGEDAPKSREETLLFQDAREQQLVRAHRSGDPKALEELLLLVEPRLLGVCFRMCRDPQDARDLCQESMVKIIQGLHLFDGRCKLSTWMIRVTMNVCLTDRRRGKIRKTASLDSAGPEKNPSQTVGAGLADDREPGALERVQRGEELQRLSLAMAKLTPEQRALLVLRDAQGLDYAEIAGILEVPVGTVKSRLFRARLALREEIERLTRRGG